MSWEQVAGIIRHILTFGGGVVVSKGWLDEATMTAVVGAIVTIGGAVWSITSKKSAA